MNIQILKALFLSLLLSGCASIPSEDTLVTLQKRDGWNRSLLNCPVGKYCDVHLESRWHMNYLNYKHSANWKYKCLILNWQYPSYDFTGRHKSVQYLCVVSKYKNVWSLIATQGPDPKYPKVPLSIRFSSEKSAIILGSEILLDQWRKKWQNVKY